MSGELSGFERALQQYSEPSAEEVTVDLRDVHEARRARAREAERERRKAEALAAAEAAEERRKQRQQAEDAAQSRQMAEEAADAEDEAMAERLREDARLEHEQRDGDDQLGEHGGGSSAPAESVQESAEPTPQQDDPDDGEHTSSEAPEEPESTAEGDEEDDDSVEEEAEYAEDEPPVEEEPLDELPEPEPAILAPEPKPKQPKQASRRPGTQAEVSAFDFAGAEEKGRSVTFKKFPVRLVDGLRSTLAAHIGEAEAKALGAQAIVTAFVSAKTGLDVGLDPSSRRAADAFAANDPGMLGVMEEARGMREDFNELVTRLGPMITRVREMSVAMEAIELSNAFLIADKYDVITPPSARSHEIDMQDPRVQAARDRIASEAADQRRLRQEREHRSNR